MALDEILAALSGSLEGGLKGYTWAKEFEQADRKIEQDGEIKRLQTEIRLMLESMKQGGLDSRTDKNNATRETIAGVNNATKIDVTELTTGAQRDIAAGRQQVDMRGQDITQQLGIMRDGTVRRGQDFTMNLGVLRDGTVRRGQDTTAGTARRGQDITLQLGIDNETGRKNRATAANDLRTQEHKDRMALEQQKLKKRTGFAGVDFLGSGTPTDVPDEGTGKPTAQPIEVKETTGGLPVTPRSPEAGADINGQLKQQLGAAIKRYQSATTPALKEAAKQEIARLRARVQQKSQ